MACKIALKGGFVAKNATKQGFGYDFFDRGYISKSV
jgi:hypothetical protein